jgi:MSHA biogenesis protein MshO
MTRAERGVTLVELIVTIVLIGIVSATVGLFLVPALTAGRDVERRAALVEAADSALRRMARDVRIALPNSVRISSAAGSFALEMIPTADGAKYCSTAGVSDCNGAAELLSFTGLDASFDVLGCFRNPTFIASSGTAAFRLVIGDLDGSAYAAAGTNAVMTPVGRVINLAVVQPAGTCGVGTSRHRLTLNAGHQFPVPSVNDRLFVVQAAAMPVTYLCNATTGTLTRYAGYAVTGAQPTNPAVAPLNAAASIAQVTGNISRCGVLGNTASVRYTGLVTLQLGVSAGGEAIELLHQVQLDNST